MHHPFPNNVFLQYISSAPLKTGIVVIWLGRFGTLGADGRVDGFKALLDASAWLILSLRGWVVFFFSFCGSTFSLGDVYLGIFTIYLLSLRVLYAMMIVCLHTALHCYEVTEAYLGAAKHGAARGIVWWPKLPSRRSGRADSAIGPS